VYLDHMFASLPQTPQLGQLKQEMLAGMEEKYEELKREGKSENEAIGIVISEFGSIEELTAELNIPVENKVQTEPDLSYEEAYAYADARRRSGLWIGLGILLCVSDIALLLVLNTLFENIAINNKGSMEIGTLVGLIVMFLFISAAVGMFIYSYMKLERFKYLERGFQLSKQLQLELQRSKENFAPTYRFSLIMGVCLLILSPAFIFTAIYMNENLAPYGISVFLMIVAIAVFLFVYYGNIQGVYTKLLRNSNITLEEKEGHSGLESVHSIIWPVAVAIFLITGAIFKRWDINWVIFPVTALISGVLGNFQKKNRKDVT